MSSLISFIYGVLEDIEQDHVIVEAGGIGYQIYISSSALQSLPSKGDTLKIYTHMIVREDGIGLYGFIIKEELHMFQKLISISGIGPKGALGILSVMKPIELSMAIITEDIQSLSKAPGIGKKTAQRIILELKDKIKTVDAVGVPLQNSSDCLGVHKQEAIEALISLGYSQGDAAKAVMGTCEDEMSTEQMIKMALKKLALL